IAIVRAYFLLFTGGRHVSTVSLGITPRERFAVLTLAALILGGGLYPQPGVVSRHKAAEAILRERTGPAETTDHPPGDCREGRGTIHSVGMNPLVGEPPMSARSAILACAAILLAASSARAEDPVKVFEQRIVPIFKSPNPSSWVQCHLAAVDLKDYILPSSTDTFLALRDQGLIDLDNPDNSKILKLINRGANDPKTAGLIPAKQRQAEYDAFAAWIKACAADPALRNAPKPAKA